jgi:L-alanine-DL-glutamate epimerase-like enolase superfamily enzyme
VLNRIDTNQSVYELGEARDIAGPQYAMVLKRHILAQKSPSHRLSVPEDRAIRRHARRAGGVCAVERALWDIAGEVCNIRVYQMLGGKWRDAIRIYADTTASTDPVEYGRRAKERKAMGLTWKGDELKPHRKPGTGYFEANSHVG